MVKNRDCDIFPIVEQHVYSVKRHVAHTQSLLSMETVNIGDAELFMIKHMLK